MTKLVSLELDYKIKVSSRVYDYLSPDYVYFNMKDIKEIYVKDKENILKGQLLFKNGNKSIYSSISGKVVGVKKITQDNNYLVIENDYKEKSIKKSVKKSINCNTKEDFYKILEEHSINISFTKKDYLLLNVIDNEPYIVNNTMYFNKNLNNILEFLDFLKELFNYKKVFILIKNTETIILNKINELLGTYPDFKLVLVPNLYLIEHQEFYKEYLETPLDNIFEIELRKFTEIEEVIEKNKILAEKYITITGDAIKNPLVINAKKGTLVKNIIDENIELLKDNNEVQYYKNGLMKGDICDINTLIVDEDFDGVIVTKKQESKEHKCINCGLCLKHCPLNLNPIEERNEGLIKCLNCGLCSYICPSNINFKELTVKDDKYE